jgi:hypothetical protein
VIVAVGAARRLGGQPILVRAAQNADYGAPMAIAPLSASHHGPATGDSASSWSRSPSSLPLHHQMADWGHIVAVPPATPLTAPPPSTVARSSAFLPR